MALQNRDLDFSHDGNGTFDAPPLQRVKFKKTGFFSFENPGFVLILYNFILALPLSYTLTRLNKHIISLVGYEKIMRCPSGIFFSGFLFVAINMWLVVGWGLQLEREAWERKGKRVEGLRRMVGWWDREVERLEGVWGEVEQLEVEEQILSESPAPGHNKHALSLNTDGNSNGKSGDVSPAGKIHWTVAKEVDEKGYEVDDGEDEESEENEESEDDDGDSE
ncbi:hypothetical protein BKA64DRAFT_16178 [Cadophora sp. MPI-SDFR-AT-0126]|nr:hypothetical protein BKA64DRAFT_16178 [Leotiomycetes sp. MPI-SDFR-AT-0126]